MQFLVLFRRKWPLTLLYRPPFILKLETPTFFGHHFFISFFLFHFPVHFIVFIVYSILPFSFLLFSHTKKDQVHKREKKNNEDDFRFVWGTFGNVKIEDVWEKYYDNHADFHRLRTAKTRFDPRDMFRSSFTVPPLSRDLK